MMQYTPSTEEIRLVTSGLSARYSFSFEEFDRWLAEEKAKVLEKAREDIIETSISVYGIVLPDVNEIIDYLAEKAETYRTETTS